MIICSVKFTLLIIFLNNGFLRRDAKLQRIFLEVSSLLIHYDMFYDGLCGHC